MKNNLFLTSIVSLSIILVFSLGYFISNLVKVQKPTIVIEKIDNAINDTENLEKLQALAAAAANVRVVASVNSDKYHYEHCSGAKRISEKNKIYFKNAAEAQYAGFTLANNCK